MNLETQISGRSFTKKPVECIEKTTQMDRILKGVMRYREAGKQTMLRQFQEVRDNPRVSYRVRYQNTLLICVVTTHAFLFTIQQ